jgi:glycosyltransferase involved in cell wall biosynthesis
LASRRGRVPILYVHHRPELGGAPRSLCYLLESLDRDRFEPHVYCPPGPVTELFADAGAVVHEGPVAAFTHIWASSYRGRRWLMVGAEGRRLVPHLRRLSQVLEEYQFPLVHLNDSPLIPAGYLARRTGARIVWHVRGALAGNGRDLRSLQILRAIGTLADRVIAINESVAEHFRSLPQLRVVHNSVDLDLFAPRDAREARVEAGLDPDRPTVGFFSYIYPLKGYREFLEMARICADRGSNAQFVMVGSGVRDEAFFRTPRGRLLSRARFVSNHELLARELAQMLELDAIARFVPFTLHPELLYAASDVVVSPSQGPELGRSLIEAAATGRPVVASGSLTGGGVVIPSETGLLVPGSDPGALAEATLELLGAPERRQQMGAHARQHAEEQFDRVRNGERVQEIYGELLAERGRMRRRRPRVVAAERPLRLLFVTPYYAPAWGFGGPPRVTWDLTRGLAKRGHLVTVFTTDALDARRRARPLHETVEGVEVTRFRNVSNSFAWRTKKFVPPGLAVAVERQVASFDLVHVTEARTVPTAAGYLAARQHGVPLCVSAHGSLPGSTGLRGIAKEAYDRLLVQPMLREASLLLAQTPHEVELYGALGGRPEAIEILALPVNLDDFDPLPTTRDEFRARLGIAPHERVVMFLGRLHYLKGIDILMESVRRAHAVDPTIRLLIVGRDDGAWKSLRGRYPDEFERGRFQFIGPLYGRDRIEAYVACDVFAITPRLWEETSLSALEAAACGRPVVLTPQAEIPGLVAAGAGMMPGSDPDAIRDAILATLDDSVEMGQAARELVRANHTVDAVVRRLELLYRERVETAAPAGELVAAG